MIFGLVELFVLLVVVLGAAFWVWMIVDSATKESDEGNTRLVWVIIIVFSGCIGAAFYFFARRPQRKTELGR